LVVLVARGSTQAVLRTASPPAVAVAQDMKMPTHLVLVQPEELKFGCGNG
jgi:hypothetical protein